MFVVQPISDIRYGIFMFPMENPSKRELLYPPKFETVNSRLNAIHYLPANKLVVGGS
jgi:hypothetical protein